MSKAVNRERERVERPASSSERVLSPSEQMRRRERRQRITIYGGRIVLLALLLGVWQWAAGQLLDPLFSSSPLEVAKQFIAWLADGSLWYHTEITLEETLLGLFFGVVSGILLGFVLGVLPTVERIFSPFIIVLNSIPKVALAPLFIIWFGVDIPMKVIMGGTIVFFLIFLNTLSGIRSVDQNLINAVRLMGGGFWDVIGKVVVPAALGFVLTGLYMAIPYALIGAVFAEMIASNHGLGFLIYSSEGAFNTAGVFAALVMLTIIAAILNAFVSLVDSKTSRWKAAVKMDGKAPRWG